jgi:hypothetical protein
MLNLKVLTQVMQLLDGRIEVLESVPIPNTITEETGFSLVDQTITINAV